MDLPSKPKERHLIPLGDLEENPFEIRAAYDESELIALATSIQEVGLLQAPVARKVGDRFQMAFGHRRRKAFARLARSGLTQYDQMPVDIMDLTDQEMFEISLSENLKREDLSPIEEAAALQQYMDEFHATSKQAAQLFGKSESTIRGMVRLLDLPEEVKEQVRSGELSQRQARKILEQPATVQRRTERAETYFDLREELVRLFYGENRKDITDQLLYKKVKDLLENNKQLERQVELMNGNKREGDRLPTSGRRMRTALTSI